jgi:superfamily II DNA or RNA helicase
MPSPQTFSPGTLVNLRGRDWIVQPSEAPDELLIIKPLGGSEDETTGIFLPLDFAEDRPRKAEFPKPDSHDLGNISSARLLYEAARLSFRNGAGPFRCLAKISFRPRAYQIVPLIMSLKQDVTRLLIADDVGIGKTVEALLIVKELLERRIIRRFAIVCLPHLCDQWQREIREKIGMDAVVIRSNTQARLDREIIGDTSVYQFYPFQIISIDYIKSDQRRAVFIQEGPEMVVVDEAHSCACPQGASKNQQQRHALVHDLAAIPSRHLILLTATPHSGKTEEFQSLLGLLDPQFAGIDLTKASEPQRKALARHYIQRRRGDVSKWTGGDTPFPQREAGEVNYNLSPAYAAFFDDLYRFARNLITGQLDGQTRRVHYWTALGLLRGVMSSPAAGVMMLQNRQSKLGDAVVGEEVLPNPHADSADNAGDDTLPEDLVTRYSWSESEKNTLRRLEKSLTEIRDKRDDAKILKAADTVKAWLAEGLNPVVFCQYIPTANYVGQVLRELLPGKVDVQIVTSEDPDDVRRDRIDAMKKADKRVLVATDCLSEGINLHELFTAVLHYDLPWNPNRLEQREGRVDRFGQTADLVKAILLYSKDNPVDGVVLNVILRKVKEIKKSTGTTVAFPEDSQSVIDAITQSLLLDDKYSPASSRESQVEFGFMESGTARQLELDITDKFKRSEELAKATRSIFAHHTIKAQSIEQDLADTDEAIGNPEAVESFVSQALPALFGAQIDEVTVGKHRAWRLYTENLDPSLKSLLPEDKSFLVSFHSPTPEKVAYLGRNHPFVEQLCQLVLAGSLNRDKFAACRASVLRSPSVQTATTLLLFRVRNVIEEKKRDHELVAEEMLVWGYRGTPSDDDFLTPEEARSLLTTIVPGGPELSIERRQRLIDDTAAGTDALRPQFDLLAEERCKQLVEAHERFCELVGHRRYQVVYPVLPMDILGLYVLIPV